MPTATEAILTRGEFETALLAAIGEFDFSVSRFAQVLASGRCPSTMLLRYAKATYQGALLFCGNLADLADQAPDAEARLILIENLLEEEGIHLRPGRGFVTRPEQRHPVLAKRFLQACGGDGEPELESAERHLSSPARRMIEEGRWLEAVSFLLIGQELRFSDIGGHLLQLFRAHGFAERDLAFFSVHIEADCAHGRQALDLVLDRAGTAAEQQACIAAAREGSRRWHERHGASRPLLKAA